MIGSEVTRRTLLPPHRGFDLSFDDHRSSPVERSRTQFVPLSPLLSFLVHRSRFPAMFMFYVASHLVGRNTLYVPLPPPPPPQALRSDGLLSACPIHLGVNKCGTSQARSRSNQLTTLHVQGPVRAGTRRTDSDDTAGPPRRAREHVYGATTANETSEHGTIQFGDGPSTPWSTSCVMHRYKWLWSRDVSMMYSFGPVYETKLLRGYTTRNERHRLTGERGFRMDSPMQRRCRLGSIVHTRHHP